MTDRTQVQTQLMRGIDRFFARTDRTLYIELEKHTLYFRRTVWGFDIDLDETMEERDPIDDLSSWAILEPVLDAFDQTKALRIEFLSNPELIGHLMIRPRWNLVGDGHLHPRRSPSFANDHWKGYKDAILKTKEQ